MVISVTLAAVFLHRSVHPEVDLLGESLSLTGFPLVEPVGVTVTTFMNLDYTRKRMRQLPLKMLTIRPLSNPYFELFMIKAQHANLAHTAVIAG